MPINIANNEYQTFFKKKLGDYGVASPAELSEEDKKNFFNEIEAEWDSENGCSKTNKAAARGSQKSPGISLQEQDNMEDILNQFLKTIKENPDYDSKEVKKYSDEVTNAWSKFVSVMSRGLDL